VPSRRTLASASCLRSLDAGLALAILASLGQQRRSIGTGDPSKS
jgi:hypothetical protein